jgi:outer membrane protein
MNRALGVGRWALGVRRPALGVGRWALGGTGTPDPAGAALHPVHLAFGVALGLAGAAAGAQQPPAVPPNPTPVNPAPVNPTPPLTPNAQRLTPSSTRRITLDEAVQGALKQNPTLEEAQAGIRRAEAAVAEARSFLLPRIDAAGQFTFQGPIPSFTITSPAAPGADPVQRTVTLGRTFSKQVSVAGSYNADLFGRARSQVSAARGQVNVARGGLYTAQNELVFAVQNVYLAALRARELVGVQQEALAAAQEQLRVAEAQLRAGTAPEFDVLRARVQVENVRQRLVEARSLEQRTIATLGRLLSVEPGVGLDLAPVDAPADAGDVSAEAARRILEPMPGGVLPAFPQSLEGALSEAFTRRPEIYRAEWARRAAEARVAFERKGRLPALGLTATGLYTPDATGFAAITKSWSIVANVTIPIWDAGLTRARTREAKADVAAAGAQIRGARDTVGEEIKQSLVDLEAAADRRRATAANTAEAREALRIAQVRYTAGLAPNVEVTDAEAALTQARANQVNADYDYLAALAALNRSLGRYAGDRLAGGAAGARQQTSSGLVPSPLGGGQGGGTGDGRATGGLNPLPVPPPGGRGLDSQSGTESAPPGGSGQGSAKRGKR